MTSQALFLQKMIRNAGEITLSYFQKNFEVKVKSREEGIVTTADFASEKAIKESIHAQFPDHDILAEESGMERFSTSQATPLWVIDPIDGTANFAKGNPYYCVSIAFGEVKQGRFTAQLGAVYQPTTNSLFFAEKGRGTFLNDQKVTVSSLNQLSLSTIVTGFSSNKGKNLDPLLKTLRIFQDECLGVRINGAAALDLAYTASGVFQGFYEIPLAPWDMAAGALLISEAQGKVSGFGGQDFCPLNDRGILAGSPGIFNEMIGVVFKNYK